MTATIRNDGAPMINVKRIGHATFEIPDIGLWGLPPSPEFLRPSKQAHRRAAPSQTAL